MKMSWLASIALAVLLLASVTGLALAAPTAEQAIPWQVIAAGGAPASGGAVTLNGTLGQTAVTMSVSADYGVGAGYWSTGDVRVDPAEGDNTLFLPSVFNTQPE
jgi:hypothetical protein